MSSTDALVDVERIVAAGGDADDVLRGVVAALADGYAWAGVFFVEGDELVLGPEAGEPQPDRRTHVAVTWNARSVAELAVDGAPETERAALERVAALIADHCLVGWDTRGKPWSP
jgi:putative methionine-R-sulfoxide reductase with GAF domain